MRIKIFNFFLLTLIFIAKNTTAQVDTFQLSPKQFPKTVAYNYHSVTFYINYKSFKEFADNKTKEHSNDTSQYYADYIKTLKLITAKLNSDSLSFDTISISQSNIDSANRFQIFDYFLCKEIENDKCVIRDCKLPQNSLI